MTELSSSQLQEKIKSGEKFLVDFYAVWCGPCRVLMQNLSIVELELDIPVFTYNIDSDPNFTRQQNVRSVPTLKLFDGGEVINISSGVLSHGQIQTFVTR
jgi:thioredoxin 1